MSRLPATTSERPFDLGFPQSACQSRTPCSAGWTVGKAERHARALDPSGQAARQGLPKDEIALVEVLTALGRDVLRARAQLASVSPTTKIPSFPAPKDGLRDPSNAQGDLRESLAFGLPWVTRHISRKTSATLLDNAGLSGRAVADEVGPANHQ